MKPAQKARARCLKKRKAVSREVKQSTDPCSADDGSLLRRNVTTYRVLRETPRLEARDLISRARELARSIENRDDHETRDL